MTFTDIPTEQTTAVTDAVLALIALGSIALLRRHRRSDPRRVRLWSWVLGILAFAAGLGTVAHGIEMSESTRDLLWRPLFLALGLVVALFAAAAIHDWKGQHMARRMLPLLVSLGLLFFLVTQAVSGSFLVFVLYEAVAMLFALAVYVRLATGRKLAGAGVVAVAIVLNIVAAAIQATESVRFTLGVPFDHNGVFHLVQMVAVVVLTAGLVQGLRRGGAPAARVH
ncbi:MAG: hypothetical protein OER90_08590 [Gemmatimonadota bacterium]|nr:hypothetical protein [Gemmatimonadota bacterium]